MDVHKESYSLCCYDPRTDRYMYEHRLCRDLLIKDIERNGVDKEKGDTLCTSEKKLEKIHFSDCLKL